MVVGSMAMGCAPRLDPEQHGEVIYEVPKIQAAQKPYPLPQLEEPKEPSGNAESP
jgi:hypothetical protein